MIRKFDNFLLLGIGGSATAATGFLISINPFNQHGVEEGKNLTYGMMGKSGYEERKEEFIKYRQQKGRVEI